MSPGEPARDNGHRSADDVDQRIHARRSERSPGERSHERARARELLGTDFFWSDLATTSRRAAAPAPAALTQAWDDAIDVDPIAQRHELRERRARRELQATGSAPRRVSGPIAPPRLDGALAPVVLDDGEATPGQVIELRTQAEEAPVRRTVVITGRGAERYVPQRRGYDANLRRHERSGFKPDRVAMWAVLLGFALLLGAATSSHAAVLHTAVLHAALHAGI